MSVINVSFIISVAGGVVEQLKEKASTMAEATSEFMGKLFGGEYDQPPEVGSEVPSGEKNIVVRQLR